MLGSTLDAGIGVIFVFLLFSLFLSTVLEGIASLFKLRGRALKITIAQMIEDPAATPRFAQWAAKGGFGLLDGLWKMLGGGREAAALQVPAGATAALDFDAVYHHPLVGGGTRGYPPSYVPAANFAAALLQTLVSEPVADRVAAVNQRVALLPMGEVRTALLTALQQAGNDWDKLQAGVEQWYEHAMLRLSGEYKRFSQAATFVLALGLAVAFNLDSIRIGQLLMVDLPLRNALVEQASNFIASHPQTAAPQGTAHDLRDRLAATRDAQAQLDEVMALTAGAPGDWASARYWLGLLVTALAGMLGAPFWFDTLMKLVNLRGAGPKPASTQETD